MSAATTVLTTFTAAEFRYKDEPLRVVKIDGAPWFLVGDIASITGAGNRRPQNALWMVEREDRLAVDARYIRGPIGRDVTRDVSRYGEVWFVSEPGAYQLALSNRSDKGAAFRRWFVCELAPAVHALEAPVVHERDLPVVHSTETVKVLRSTQVSKDYVRIEAGAHSLYRLFSRSGELLYVGIANDVERRMAQHRQDKPWWPQVADAVVEEFPDRRAALAAERVAIRTEGPVYNVMHRIA